MASEFIRKIIDDLNGLKKQVEEIKKATEAFNNVKISGHGKIIVSGIEFKANATTDLRSIMNRLEELSDVSAWQPINTTLSTFSAMTDSAGYLYNNGSGTLTWESGTVTPHNMLSSTHADSTANGVFRGSLITGQGASPVWGRLALGSSGYFLKSNGTDAVWAAHGLDYSDVGALAVDGTAADSDLFNGQLPSYYATAVHGVSQYYIPYANATNSWANSPFYTNGSVLGINTTGLVPTASLTIDNPGSSVYEALRLRDHDATRYRASMSISSNGFSFNSYDDTGSAYMPMGFQGLTNNFIARGSGAAGYHDFITGTAGTTKRMRISDDGTIYVNVTNGVVSNPATYPGRIYLNESGVNGPQAIGGIELQMYDASNGYGSKIYSDYSSAEMGIATRAWSATWTKRFRLNNGSGNVSIGNIATTYKFQVDGDISIKSGSHYKVNGTNIAHGDINFATLAAYANNAAAVAGGLSAGQLYRDGGDPDSVCVVH